MKTITIILTVFLLSGIGFAEITDSTNLYLSKQVNKITKTLVDQTTDYRDVQFVLTKKIAILSKQMDELMQMIQDGKIIITDTLHLDTTIVTIDSVLFDQYGNEIKKWNPGITVSWTQGGTYDHNKVRVNKLRKDLPEPVNYEFNQKVYEKSFRWTASPDSGYYLFKVYAVKENLISEISCSVDPEDCKDGQTFIIKK